MFKTLNRLGDRGRFIRGTITFILVVQLAAPSRTFANPIGGNVIAGSAQINGGAGTLTVNQASQRAIINWQDFSIAQGELTKFVQPSASSAALNRVIGSNLSGIYGTLQANGQVYLINPNGIVIGPTGVVNTGGFVASTLDVDNSQFLAGGDLTFKGNSTAKVVNLGKIGAGNNDVILIAQEVENHGEINAPNGTAALAAGNEVLVKASGQERIFVQAGKGKVSNSGLIQSATAELKAAGGNEYALAINNEGTVRATGAVNSGGRILLTANKGTVRNTGTLTAKGSKNAKVKVVAEKVEMKDSAQQAAGVWSDGDVTIEGENGVDLTLLAHSDSWISAAENLILKSDATVLGDAHFKSTNFSVEKLDGTAGNFTSPHDPIILATGNVSLGDYSGLSLHILAGGSIIIGNVSITGADPTVGNSINSSNTATYNGTNTIASLASLTTSGGDSLTINGNTQATLDLRAGIDWSLLGGLGTNYTVASPAFTGNPASASFIQAGQIDVASPGGTVLLTNQYQANNILLVGFITTGSISTSSAAGNGGNVWIDSRNGLTVGGAISTSSSAVSGNAGSVNLRAALGGVTVGGRIQAQSETPFGAAGNAGNVKIAVQSGMTLGGHILAYSNSNSSSAGNGGNVSLSAATGPIIFSGGEKNIDTYSSGQTLAGNGGSVTLQATGALTMGRVHSYSRNLTAGQTGSGGNVQIALANLGSTNGTDSLVLGDSIDARSWNQGFGASHIAGSGGSVQLSAVDGGVTYTSILTDAASSGTTSTAGAGGLVTVQGDNGTVTGGAISTTSSANGTSGNGGAVTVSSVNGNVNLGSNAITTTSTSSTQAGNSGSVGITANNGSIQVGSVNSSMTAFGGSSAMIVGKAGSISLGARDGITVSGILNAAVDSGLSWVAAAAGTADAGSISLISQNGSISVTGAISSYTANNQSSGNTGNILGNGGNITLQALNGNIILSTMNLASYSSSNRGQSGNGGDILIEARNLGLNNSTVNSYSRSFNSNSSHAGSGGDVTINVSAGGLTFTSIDASTRAENLAQVLNVGSGGKVSLTAAGAVSNLSNTISTYASGTGQAGSAGDISITGSSISVGNLSAYLGGDSSAGKAGGVTLTAQSGNLTVGTILTNASAFTDVGNAGDVTATASLGSIQLDSITSSNVIMSSSTTAVAGLGGSINLGSGGGISLTGGIDTRVYSELSGAAFTAGTADAGNISLISQGGNISVGGAISVYTSNNQSSATAGNVLGNGGNVTLQALNGSVTFTSPMNLAAYSSSNRGQSGNGGDILIEARFLGLNGSTIDSYSRSFNSNSSHAGSAGDVIINVSVGGLTFASIDAAARAENTAQAVNAGSGGKVSLTAAGAVSNSGNSITTYASGAGQIGSAGDISITGSSISVGSLSAYLTGNSSAGKAGDVTLTAQSGDLTAGNISANASAFSEVGDAGDITATASQGAIQLGSLTSSNVVNSPNTTAVSGLGGSITLSGANGITLTGGLDTRVYSDQSGAAFTAGTADAGNISLISQNGNISVGGSIWSFTSNNQSSANMGNVLGNAGNITLQALNGVITLVPMSMAAYSSSNRGQSGNGGDILIEARFLDLNGSTISSGSRSFNSNSSHAGSAGDVTINVSVGGLTFASIDAAARAENTAQTVNAGSGGKVSLTAAGVVSNSSSMISTYALGSGQIGSAGDISITGSSISVGSLNAYLSGNSSAGKAGDVTLTSQNGDVTAGTIAANASAFTEVGDAGSVTVTATGGAIQLTSVGTSNVINGASTTAVSGLGGDISLSAATGITVTGALDTRVYSENSAVAFAAGTADAGDISLVSQFGNISVGGTIATFTTNSQSAFSAGNVLGNAGNMTFQALNGGINLSPSFLSAYSWSNRGQSGNGGDILIESRFLNLNGSTINSYSRSTGTNATHAGSGGDVTINLSVGGLAFNSIDASARAENFSGSYNAGSGGAVSLSAANAVSSDTISSYASASNQVESGGDIGITGSSITVGALNAYLSGSSVSGKAGDVTLTGQSGSVTSGSINASASSNLNVGDGGNVNVTANSFGATVQVASVNTSNTVTGSNPLAVSGLGGNISLNAPGSVTVTGALDARVFSENSGAAFAAGTADAGDISVISQNGIISVGTGIYTLTANNQSSATAGNVLGNAGDITLQALNGVISLDSTFLSAFSSSNRGQSGNGGDILIESQSLFLGSTAINSFSRSFGGNASHAGNGGDVTLTLSNGSLGFTVLNTSARADAGPNLNAGSAGSVTLTAAGTVGNANNEINATAYGTGQAGSGGDISITGSGISVGNLSSSSTGNSVSGDGGDIIVTAQNGNIVTGDINSSAFAVQAGDGGSVTASAALGGIQVGAVNSGSSVANFATTAVVGSGGDISLSARDFVTAGGAVTSAVYSAHSGVASAAGTADAGNISIISQNGTISLTSGVTSTTSNAATSATVGNVLGNAGGITLQALNGHINIGSTSFNAYSLSSGGQSGNGGDILVEARTIGLGNTPIYSYSRTVDAGSSHAGNGGDITVNLSGGDLLYNAIDASSRTDATSAPLNAGNGGSVALSSPGLISGTADISTYSKTLTGSAGTAGGINITGGAVTATSLSAYVLGFSNVASAQSGNVKVKTTLGLLNVGTVTTAVTAAATTGSSAGSIDLESANNLQAGSLTSSNIATGSGAGNAGGIKIKAAGNLTLPANLIANSEGISGSGNGGNVSVAGLGGLNLNSIRTFTFASGLGGIAGNGGSIDVFLNTTGVAGMDDFSVTNLYAGARGSGGAGNGGSIRVAGIDANTALNGSVTVTNGLETYSDTNSITSVTTASVGTSGDILIRALEGITLPTVRQQSVGVLNSGGTGSLTLISDTGTITLNGLNKFATASEAVGNSGATWIESKAQTVSLFSGISGYTTSTGAAGSTGNGGSVTVKGQLGVSVNGGINVTNTTAQNSGTGGNAGDVTIQSAQGGVTVAGGITANVVTSTGSSNLGNSGSVDISAKNSVALNGTIYTNVSTTGTAGSGGNVSITSTDSTFSLGVSNSIFADTRGNTQVGNGGSITINAKGPLTLSQIFTTSRVINQGQGGNSGNVQVTLGDLGATNGTDGFTSSSLSTFVSVESVSGPAYLGNAGSVQISTADGDIAYSSLTAGTVTGGATSAGNGGSVSLNAGNGKITGFGIVTSVLALQGTGNGGAITLVAGNGDVNVNSASISANSTNNGASGNAGNAGSISITASNGNLLLGALTATSSITNTNTTGAVGKGGNITLNASGNISAAAISSNASPGGSLVVPVLDSADAGDISITSQNGNIILSSTVSAIAQITSTLSPTGGGQTGNSGNITLRAVNGNIAHSGSNLDTSSISSNGRSGNAGDIEVNAKTVSQLGNLFLSSRTNGSSGSLGSAGNAGNLKVTVGSGGLNVGIIETYSSTQGSGAYDSGNGGDVEITIGGALTGASTLNAFSSSSGGNAGQSGDIKITADSISLLANISANSTGRSVAGSGTINMEATAGSLVTFGVTNSVTASTASGLSGNAGSITLTGRDGISTSLIASRNLTDQTTGQGGNGGAITLTSSQGSVTVNGSLQSDTFGSGNQGSGGNISVTARNGILLGNSVNASAFAVSGTAGGGGDISLISSQGGLSFSSAPLFYSSATGVNQAGDAGDITIQVVGPLNIGTSTLNAYSRVSNGGQGGSGGAVRITVGNSGVMDKGDALAVGTILTDSTVTSGTSAIIGNGGAIELRTTDGDVTYNTLASKVSMSTTTGTGGSGGAVTIVAGNGKISGNGIDSSVSGGGTVGNGGNVDLTAGDGAVNLGSNYIVTSATNSGAAGNAGNGGNVTVLASTGTLQLFGVWTYSQLSDAANVTGRVGNGGDISLTGAGDVTIGGGSLFSRVLSNMSGVVHAAGTADGGDVTLISQNGNISLSSSVITGAQSNISAGTAGHVLGNSGSITLQALNGSVTSNTGLDTSVISFNGRGGNGGAVNITGRSVSLANSNIVTFTRSRGASGANAGDAGAITIEATAGNLALLRLDGTSLAETGSTGRSGSGAPVELTASGAITVPGGIATSSQTAAANSGLGGDVTIRGSSFSGALISTGSLAYGTGAVGLSGGDVLIESTGGNVVLAGISTQGFADLGRAGNAGSIEIHSAGGISSNTSLTATSTGVLGAGNGGNVSLEAAGLTNINFVFISTNTTATNGQAGQGGDITMESGAGLTVGLLNATSASSVGAGADGGDISIDVTGSVQVSGFVTWTDAGMNSNLGDAGDVTILARNSGAVNGLDGITIQGTVIMDSTVGFGGGGIGGRAGNLTLTTEDGSISLNTVNLDSTGWTGALGSGRLEVSAVNGNVSIISFSAITTSNNGPIANSAGVGIQATGNIVLGPVSTYNTATTGNSGNGGGVNLQAGGTVNLNGIVSTYSSSTSGNSGNGGALVINSGGALTVGAVQSHSLTGAAGTVGNGGAISLTSTTGNVTLSGALRNYSSKPGTGTGSGGAVTVTAANGTILGNGGIIDSYGEANGGNVLLSANSLQLNSSLTITTDSGTTDGDITVAAPFTTSTASSLILNGGQNSLVRMMGTGNSVTALAAYGGEVRIAGSTAAAVADLRAYGENGSSGDIFVNGGMGYVSAGGSGAYQFLAASDVFFNSSAQLDGTGNLTAVGGWDKTSLSFVPSMTATTWGANSGSVYVNSAAGTQNVVVGSRGGSNTILGYNVSVISGSDNAAYGARVGSELLGSGSITVAAKNDVTVTGNVVGSNARIGHAALSGRSGTVTVLGGNNATLSNANSFIEAGGNIALAADVANARPNFSSTALLTNNGTVTSDSGSVAFYGESPGQVTIGTVNQTAGTFGKRYNIYYGDAGYIANGVNYKYQPVLSFTVADQSKTYGETFTFDSSMYTYTGGLEFGDNLTDAISSGPTLSSLGAVDTANVTGSPYAITMSVASTLGYGFNITEGELTVDKRNISVAANGGTKVYGSDDPSSVATAYTLTSGTLALSQNLTGSLGRVAGETVGNYNFTQGSVTVGDGDGGNNYNISFDGTTNPFVITRSDLTGSIANQNKVYGANDPALSGIGVTLGGVVNRSVTDINGNVTVVNDVGLVQTSLASLTRAAGEDVANYSITAASFNALTGSAAPNYNAPAFTGTPTLSITAASLTGSIANQSKIYGANDPSLSGIVVTLGGLINRNVSTWNGSVAVNDSAMSTSLASLTRGAGESVGNYAITGASFNTLTGGTAGNYNVPVFVGSPTLNISRASLTGSIGNQSKVYGANDPSLAGISVTLGGLINRTVSTWNGSVGVDDSADVQASLASLTRAAGENVANYSITAATFNALTGSASGNYNAPTFTGTPTLSITPASLTGSISNQSKVYGANDPSLSGIAVTLGGLINRSVSTWNGSVGVDDSAMSTSLASLTRGAGESVGNYSITAASFNTLTGGSAANYNVPVFVGAPTLNVSRANLTGSIADQSKVYGANDPALSGMGVTLGGLINRNVSTWNGSVVVDDSAAVSVSLSGLVRNVGEDVGDYSITSAAFNALTGSSAGNYNVPLFVGSPVLSITQASLTGSIANQNKIYGDADPAPGGILVTLGGLINQSVSTWNGSVLIDDSADVSVSLSGYGRDTGENVGNYAITSLAFNPLTGGSSGNYSTPVFAGSPILTISARAITVTAGGGTSTYGDNPANPGISLTGGTLGFSDTLVSIGLGNDFAIDGTTTVGDYDILVTGSNANYTITKVDGNWTVTTKALTVTANNQNKTYGDTFTFNGTEFGTSGLINGDTVTMANISSGGSVNTATVGGGPYTISIGSATGAGLENYTISYVTGSMTVDKRDITVTANGGTSTYGDSPSDPGLSASNLASFDNVSALTGLSNSFGITSATTVDDYTLTVDGTLTNSNYNITSRVDGNWTVTTKALTVTADNQNKTYGDTFTFNGTEFGTSGLINGDTVASSSFASAGAVNTATVAGGPYGISISSAAGTGLGNYSITYVGGSMTVSARDITVTANSGTSTYGDSPVNPGLSATNLASFDDVSALTGLSSSFGIAGTTGVGNYTLTVGGTLTNTNYNITGRSDGNWMVDPRSITIAVDAGQGKVYGNGDPTLTYSVGGGGLVNGDTLSGNLVRALGENVGNYNISQGTLAASANYTVASYSNGNFAVAPRPITITAGSGISDYGTNPANPGIALTGGSMAFAETLASLGFGNNFGINSSTDIGTYAIEVTGNNANYAITRANGRWRVTNQGDRLSQIFADFQSGEASDENKMVSGVTDFKGDGKSTISYGSGGPEVSGALVHVSSGDVE